MSLRVILSAIVILVLVAIFRVIGDSDAADLVLTNGNIVTVDDGNPTAQAIAIREGKILAVGSAVAIDEFVGRQTEIIDLEGQTAIPGFIEGHAHFNGVGQAQLQLNLMSVANWDEVVAMVEEAANSAEPGELILGRGWHQEKWDRAPTPNVEGIPLHITLSAASPDNPVLLTHVSGHAVYANAKAMELSGIDNTTPDPSGGEIIRDGMGNPIGYFRETASRLLAPAREGATPTDPRRVVELAQEEALSKGITSFQDAGSSFEQIDIFKEMAEDGSLDIRLWVMVRESVAELTENLAEYRMIGVGEDRLTVRAIKMAIDGALGSHGAWLLEPYADLPESAGLNTSDLEDAAATAELAIEHGYQFAMHAIGDRGNRETLDMFQWAFDNNPDEEDLRWRIEHAQNLHPDDIPRFENMQVIAAMQGVHATSDGPWITDRLGQERVERGAYVWRDLIDAGVIIGNGTDAPVEDVDPIASYYSSVSRMMSNGEVLTPRQKMTRMEALKSYTINNAYAGFEEDIKGSLEVGKLADITVLDRDILTIPEEDIPNTAISYTIVGGEVMYSGNNN
ncbi:MAG: amidohydrolase [Longimicrobiales bacterium]|nr:amidohydrolase [Longimicrobiales bacterium]